VTAFHAALTCTLLLLAALMTLGLSRQLGERRGDGERISARWPHHALYFLVMVGTLLVGVLALLGGRPWWPALLLTVLLLGMSRTRPGQSTHWQLATLIAALYLAAAWLWR
jgi:hypothetical protein